MDPDWWDHAGQVTLANYTTNQLTLDTSAVGVPVGTNVSYAYVGEKPA